MYEIYKNGVLLSREDKARYVKLQANGIYCLCAESEAMGIVVNNDYICHLDGKPALFGMDTVTMREVDDSAMLTDALNALAILGVIAESEEENG